MLELLLPITLAVLAVVGVTGGDDSDGGGSNSTRTDLDDDDIGFDGTDTGDHITGNALGNTVSGGAGNDLLELGPGNDRANGNTGDDLIFGGPGDDTLHGGWHDDRIFAGDGDDTVTGFARGDDLIRGGQGHDNLADDLGHNTLFGDTGADTLDTRDSADDEGTFDMAYGGYGADRLIGDGGDTLFGGEGTDQFNIYVAPGIDTLHGPVLVSDMSSAESLHIVVAEATEDDVVTARLAANGLDTEVIYQNETVAILKDVQRLSPSQVVFAPMTLVGTDADDTLTGSAVDGTTDAGAGDDTVIDTSGRDLLIGGTGSDTLIAIDEIADAPDTLLGGDGADRLIGDDGDEMAGGAASDIFVWNGLDRSSLQMKPVVVHDYVPGLDKLEANLGFGPYTPSIRIEDSGDGDTFVRVNGKALFRLQGISASEVNTADVHVNRL